MSTLPISTYLQEKKYKIEADLGQGGFGVTTDEELAENLMYDTNMYNINNLPKPSNNLWITSEGVVFLYTPYEISYYAAGSPTFAIPSNQIKDALTVVGKSYFE